MTAREIADGLMDEHAPSDWRGWASKRDLRDAIESALLAAERRGFEGACAELGYGRNAPKPSPEQEAWIIDHRASISDIPALMSLLYDLDRLPEQVVSARAASELILIVSHFQAFKDSLLSDDRRQAEITAAERRVIERAAHVVHSYGCGAHDCPVGAAILALAPEGDGWETIDSAPDDGRRVLVHDPRMKDPIEIRGADGAWWRHYKVPLKWRPLPSPPKATE